MHCSRPSKQEVTHTHTQGAVIRRALRDGWSKGKKLGPVLHVGWVMVWERAKLWWRWCWQRWRWDQSPCSCSRRVWQRSIVKEHGGPSPEWTLPRVPATVPRRVSGVSRDCSCLRSNEKNIRLYHKSSYIYIYTLRLMLARAESVTAVHSSEYNTGAEIRPWFESTARMLGRRKELLEQTH